MSATQMRLPACGCGAAARAARRTGAVASAGATPARVVRSAGGLLRVAAAPARTVQPRPRRAAPVRAEPEESADAAAAKSGLLSRDNPDLVERFAVIGSGSAECKSCQYVYEPKNGDESYPVAKGTRFENLPADWRCPTCGADQKLFVSKAKTVAGFSQNQGYGMGANTMTSEQKSLLIYGSLATFFALFLAGYLLD